MWLLLLVPSEGAAVAGRRGRRGRIRAGGGMAGGGVLVMGARAEKHVPLRLMKSFFMG